MAQSLPQLDNSEYTVGWITALHHERAAAESMLDEEHAPPLQKHVNDHNIYSLGSIIGPRGKHNVVVVSFPSNCYGTTPAATAAAQMLSSFPALKLGLMVGIGGGIPSDENDIRLGDVVISSDKSSGGSDIPALLEAMCENYPMMARPREGPGYIYQGATYDRLFQPDYVHATAGKQDCSRCSREREIKRKQRSDLDPYVHYGTIASGNMVIKNAQIRDRLSGCLCFEIEAAGLMNDFPCLVIRGICDYCDSHKNDMWQKYAAATTAAYTKELLMIIDVVDVNSTPEARTVMAELQDLKSATNKIVSSLEEHHLNQKQRDILEWLSPFSPYARHFESQKIRVEGTGSWLLDDPDFISWSSTTPRFQKLCCYGDAGAGKTIISTLVIDELVKKVATEENVGLAYIYFDYQEQKKYTPENIFDALDELELGNLRTLLEWICDGPPVKYFLTGRGFVQGTVQEYFEDAYNITIAAHKSDIRNFIEHGIGGPHDIAPTAMDEKFKFNIIAKHINSADISFDPRGKPEPDILLRSCHGLAVVDKKTSTIRMVHYSLQEYLSLRNEIFGVSKLQWHSRIACTCLTFLRISPAEDMKRFGELTPPFFYYAARTWVHHLRKINEIQSLAFELAKAYSETSRVNKSKSLGLLINHTYSVSEFQGVSSLSAFVATTFGLERIILYLSQRALQLDSRNLRVDLMDKKGRTPLSWAAQIGNESIVCLLLENGVEVDSMDISGQTPLTYATKNGHEAVTKILIENHATVDLMDKEGWTPLAYATKNGHEAVTEILIENNATVDPVNKEVRTPLFWASRRGFESIVCLLLEKGAGVNKRDQRGRTPLFWAIAGYSDDDDSWERKWRYYKLYELNARAGELWVQMERASPQASYDNIIRMLLEKGAFVDIEDNEGQTIMSVAALAMPKDTLELLLLSRKNQGCSRKYTIKCITESR